MVILTLDLSVSDLGYCILDTSNLTYRNFGRITTKKFKEIDNKIIFLLESISGIIKMYNVDIVISEKINRSPNPETIWDINKLVGGIMKVCNDLEIQYEFELKRNFWIEYVIDKRGNFKKADAFRVIARKYINIGDIYYTNKKKNDNIYHAIGMCIGYAKMKGLI